MSESLPRIRGFLPTTMIDWCGKLASTLFLSGCNLRCRFCHAGALIFEREPPESIPFESIAEHLKTMEGWIDGVVICGGEPTIHPGLRDLCIELKALGLAVKLDTNGTAPEVLRSLIADGLVDAVAMDIKAPLDDRYAEVCGTEVNLEAIRRSIGLLMDCGAEVEFRTTMCPAFVDEEEIHAMGAAIRGAELWVLQSFSPEEALEVSLRDLAPWPPQKMSELAKAGGLYVDECLVRGQPQQQAARLDP
ncbi:MAG: anaerobic ribonucleoside-triphosphate reductase activating protein [Planctomycetia bacterium]|nr:anaerobic ribonucleoside-triphosphate reductase activating protein [Planctomycetia bacterium]